MTFTKHVSLAPVAGKSVTYYSSSKKTSFHGDPGCSTLLRIKNIERTKFRVGPTSTSADLLPVHSCGHPQAVSRVLRSASSLEEAERRIAVAARTGTIRRHLDSKYHEERITEALSGVTEPSHQMRAEELRGQAAKALAVPKNWASGTDVLLAAAALLASTKTDRRGGPLYDALERICQRVEGAVADDLGLRIWYPAFHRRLLESWMAAVAESGDPEAGRAAVAAYLTAFRTDESTAQGAVQHAERTAAGLTEQFTSFLEALVATHDGTAVLVLNRGGYRAPYGMGDLVKAFPHAKDADRVIAHVPMVLARALVPYRSAGDVYEMEDLQSSRSFDLDRALAALARLAQRLPSRQEVLEALTYPR